jgi:hypothetical protein
LPNSGHTHREFNLTYTRANLSAGAEYPYKIKAFAVTVERRNSRGESNKLESDLR